MAAATVSRQAIRIDGQGLSLDAIDRIARLGSPVELNLDHPTRSRIERSARAFCQAAQEGIGLYGVTTQFGGRSDTDVPSDAAELLQANLIHSHLAGTGKRLPTEDVRAGIAIRLNSLIQGNSGVRVEILENLGCLLNRNVIPHVFEHGSIGASGDLVPLAYVAGCLMGLPSVEVDVDGVTMSAERALRHSGLEPMSFRPKEALAIINGTAMTAGIAVNAIRDVMDLLTLSMVAHGFFMQAMQSSREPLDEFIHACKPHAGQGWIALQMRRLLDGVAPENGNQQNGQSVRGKRLIQDRYATRCLPQFLGPIADGIKQICAQIETECNSVTDNPLWDHDSNAFYHGGNFLAQYLAVGMDQTRYYLSLLAKHLDVQIAHLALPEFSNGLPASLCWNNSVSGVGLKALQLNSNSIVPRILQNGTSLADRFPTYAEQFNQNINSQGYGSALLTRQSVELFQELTAVALLTGLQAVDLRAHLAIGQCDPRPMLSQATEAVYVKLREVLESPPQPDSPLVSSDASQSLGKFANRIVHDIRTDRKIMAACRPLRESLAEFIFDKQPKQDQQT